MEPQRANQPLAAFCASHHDPGAAMTYQPFDLSGKTALMSDASSYHTGDTFLIDGGYSLF